MTAPTIGMRSVARMPPSAASGYATTSIGTVLACTQCPLTSTVLLRGCSVPSGSTDSAQ